MGFDIFAVDENGKEVGYFRTYMGGFRMMYEQGYDWFKLIDAYDCYGGVSGNGESKRISLEKLEHALQTLIDYDPKGRLSSEGRDELGDGGKENIQEFMETCISWIKENKKESILIQFS